MKSNRNIVFIIAGAIIFLIGFYFILTNIKNYKWYETYQKEDDNPYGNYVLVELLKSFHKVQVVKKPLTEVKLKSGNYLFIGSFSAIDSAETVKLLEYVKKGNKAFFLTNSVPFEVLKQLQKVNTFINQDSLNQYVEKPKVRLKLIDSQNGKSGKFTFTHVFKNKPEVYFWSYLDTTYLKSKQDISYLGLMEDQLINYCKINYGKGSIYLHTNPIVFTNYFLIQEAGIKYADRVFSDLNTGTIYFDEYNTSFHKENPSERTKSPLKFILSEDALKYGWYLGLLLVLLYILFYSKRRQRVIPVIEGNFNTTLEFTETIGKLYFLQNNHKKLAHQKMKHFLGFIRSRYHVLTNTLDSNFIKKLSQKSGLPLNEVEIIFYQYKSISASPNLADDTLINFHQALEYFYQNCK